MNPRTPSRYHPLLVALHWALALLVVAQLGAGFLWLGPLDSVDPRKLGILRTHMAVGMFVLALMLMRLVVRAVTARPPAAMPDHLRLARWVPRVHRAFYALVFLLAGTGYATALLAHLNDIVFGGSGAPLPATLANLPTFVAHALLAGLLAALVLGHVAAALHHQWRRHDGLLARMAFGPRWGAGRLPSAASRSDADDPGYGRTTAPPARRAVGHEPLSR